MVTARGCAGSPLWAGAKRLVRRAPWCGHRRIDGAGDLSRSDTFSDGTDKDLALLLVEPVMELADLAVAFCTLDERGNTIREDGTIEDLGQVAHQLVYPLPRGLSVRHASGLGLSVERLKGIGDESELVGQWR